MLAEPWFATETETEERAPGAAVVLLVTLVTTRSAIDAANVAVTVVAALTVTVHGSVPVQLPPDHPVKLEPVAGVAVNVTGVPKSKSELAPTPTGVTVPLPLPAPATLSANFCSVNVAVTVVAAFTVTVHGAVPVHPPPLQPVKVEPVAGVAVSVTDAPAL